jgi:dephospho-CoA kinase
MLVFFWILFPFYYALLLFVLAIVALNTKKIRRKYKFDTIFAYIPIYLMNVMIIHLIEAGYVGVILTTAIMLYVIIKASSVQIIGVTGGMGCGKSTVSKSLNQDFKLTIIDCDVLARRIVEIGKPAYNKIVAEYGSAILDPDTKELNRKAVAEIVFKNESIRRKYTRMTGTYIMIEIVKEIIDAIRNKKTLVVLDAPLLFESKYLPYLCYPIITVYVTDETLQVKRIIERDRMTIEEAKRRIDGQMPIGKKLAGADIKLNNDGDVSALKHKLFHELGTYVL